MRFSRVFILLTFCILVLLTQLLPAQTGAINTALKAATTVTCGMVITTPGTYTISGLLQCSASDGVHINSSNVTLQFVTAGAQLGELACGGCPPSGGTQTAIKVYDPAGGPITNVNILGSGTIDSYPIGVSLAGVTESQVSGLFFNFVPIDISFGDDTNGDHSRHDLFTNNSSYFTVTSGIAGSVDDSIFVGNSFSGSIFGGVGTGLQIINGNGNSLLGNRLEAFSVGIELGGAGSTIVSNNTLIGNTVGANTTGLIVMPPANHNRFDANYFYGNSTLDVNEGNPSCGTDVYKRNIFGTANQSCI